jgi:transposase-like protein
MKTIEEIKNEFQELPGLVQEQLLDDLLQDFELRGQVLENVKDELSRKNNKKPCPHCSSKQVYKRGKQSGVQMYQCRDCSKWYSETTGTPLWDIKLKNKWQGFLRCFDKGMSIKKISEELEISIQTSFDWRHKLLSTLNNLAPTKLSNVVECDELELSIRSCSEITCTKLITN